MSNNFNFMKLTLLFGLGKEFHHPPRTTWHQSPCFCGTALHTAWKVFPSIIKRKQMATRTTLIQNCIVCPSYSGYFIANNQN